jgi:hypothetical protein
MKDNAREVFNLNDLLPLDGEDRLEISTDGGELNIDIFYETSDTEPRTAKLRIHFPFAPYFVKTPFPGYGIIEDMSVDGKKISGNDAEMLFLNSLVEYRYSIMLDGLHKSSEKYEFRSYADCKHYRLFLHSVGVAINVIAESCKIINL